MTFNAYLNRFRSVKCSNHAWNACDILMVLFPVLRVFWRNNIASVVVNTSWKPPGNAISETLNFKMSLDASALKKLCLWCKFQSRLLIIIGLLLKNFLTALLVKRLLTAKVLINNNTFPNDRYDTNSPLYSYRCRWGWSWPCFDTILSAFLHVGKKRKEVCVKLGQPQPRSPLLKGQDTKPTALDT